MGKISLQNYIFGKYDTDECTCKGTHKTPT